MRSSPNTSVILDGENKRETRFEMIDDGYGRQQVEVYVDTGLPVKASGSGGNNSNCNTQGGGGQQGHDGGNIVYDPETGAVIGADGVGMYGLPNKVDEDAMRQVISSGDYHADPIVSALLAAGHHKQAHGRVVQYAGMGNRQNGQTVDLATARAELQTMLAASGTEGFNEPVYELHVPEAAERDSGES